MPLNESSTKKRERWPLSFDLEGVPRQTAMRQRLLEQQQKLELEQTQMSEKNQFAVDYQTETVRDINNPPRKPYRHQEYPKMVYHHDSGHVLQVADKREEQAAARKGFQLKPSPAHDYSKVKVGRTVPLKPEAPEREEEMSAGELVEIEEGERELAEEEQAALQQGSADDHAEEEASSDEGSENSSGRSGRKSRRG